MTELVSLAALTPSPWNPRRIEKARLIAAEQLGRTCYAMEIEPAYCDVSVRRWERVSGRQAHKANA